MSEELKENNIAVAPIEDNADMMMMNFDVKLAKTPKFEPIKQYGDLCVGKLIGVTVEERPLNENKEDGTPSTYEFAGHTIPRLVFTFHNHILKGIDEVNREFIKDYSVITYAGDAETPDSLKNKKLVYQGMFDQIQYMMQFFMSINKGLTPPVLKGINPTATTEERIIQTRDFFTAVANWFNTALVGKPVYKIAEQARILAIKLVARKKQNAKGGHYLVLDFPGFIKEGFLDVFTSLTVKPAIKIGNGESVITTSVNPLLNSNKTPDADTAAPDLSNLDPTIRAMLENDSK